MTNFYIIQSGVLEGGGVPEPGHRKNSILCPDLAYVSSGQCNALQGIII